MSSPITEILTVTGNDALAADPELFYKVKYAQIIAAKTTDAGMIRQAWGFRTEEPKVWQGFIDWPTIEHHQKVGPALRADKEVMDVVSKVVDTATPPKIVHVSFAPYENYKKAVEAPLTEVVFTRVKDGADLQEFKDAAEFALATSGGAEGCFQGAWGFTVEDEKVAALLIGWESREAHHKFENTQGRKDLIARFIKVGDIETLVHVKLQIQ